MGPSERRNRPSPMWRPPSKRMTRRATTAIRSTSRTESTSWRSVHKYEMTAAPTRKSAAYGREKPIGNPHPEQRDEHRRRDGEDDVAEIADLGQGTGERRGVAAIVRAILHWWAAQRRA